MLVRVTAVEGSDVVARVAVPGPVSNNKGLNLPGRRGLHARAHREGPGRPRWARGVGVDFVALSFVRSADDSPTSAGSGGGEPGVPVIAKIEKPQAVENLDAIIAASDAVMVARGDLGVEMALEQVPAVQKRRSTARRRASR